MLSVSGLPTLVETAASGLFLDPLHDGKTPGLEIQNSSQAFVQYEFHRTVSCFRALQCFGVANAPQLSSSIPGILESFGSCSSEPGLGLLEMSPFFLISLIRLQARNAWATIQEKLLSFNMGFPSSIQRKEGQALRRPSSITL